MRVLRGADVKELAAEMFNMEAGAEVMAPNFTEREPPHDPFPMFEIPPRTTRGAVRRAHYRPAVGIVYYAQPARGATQQSLVTQIVGLLDSKGFSHLSGARACATTAAATFRVKKPVRVKTKHLSSQSVSAAFAGATTSPTARLIADCAAFTPPHDFGEHLCVGKQAIFTWVFLPADYAIIKETDFTNSKGYSEVLLNIRVASILFDPSGWTVDSLPKTHLNYLTREDFRGPAKTSCADAIQQLCGATCGAALLFCEGRFRFVGREDVYRAECRQTEIKTDGSERTISNLQCDACDAPLRDAAMVLTEIRRVHTEHATWYMHGAAMPSCVGMKNIVLCGECRISAACAEHLGTGFTYARCEMSQAEICKRLKKYECLVPLLEGEVRRVERAPGVFHVRHGASNFLVAGISQKREPLFQCPELADPDTTVVTQLKIIEAV